MSSTVAIRSPYWRPTRAVSTYWPKKRARSWRSWWMRGRSPRQVLCCTSSTSDEERRNAMPPIDERMNSVMLSIIRRRTPSADVGDFNKLIYDLDMDSLDVVDLSQALEKEFGVEADLERVSDCLTPSEIGSYFRELIGSP